MAFRNLHSFIPKTIDPNVVCGIDEVGRGPWAGPLVACALMFTRNFQLKGLKDSKQLTHEKRELFYHIIQQNSDYGIGIVEVEEIDRLGLIKATNLAFVRALQGLQLKPEFLVVDGRDKLTLPHPFCTVIKGDEKLKVIACASIMAKVTRDRMMASLAKKYPHYGFEDHKGYGTQRHQKALKKHGVCVLHRKSFLPIKQFLAA